MSKYSAADATSEEDLQTRRERRAAGFAERRAARDRVRAANASASRSRTVVFGAIVVAVLVVGGFLAFGDFFNRPSSANLGAIDVQSSMAGFTPSEIHVTAGTTAVMNWWTDDAAVHLNNAVHTMIAPELGLNEELAAESNRAFSWQVPNMPGTYDVWCDSCCGGKDSPQMHGKIVIDPAKA